MIAKPLWAPSPDRLQNAELTHFTEGWNRPDLAESHDYAGLHAASVAEPEAFWNAVWDFAGIVGDKGAPPSISDGEKMPGARFFPNARLNFAENLLRSRGEGDALVFRGEDKVERRLSWDALRASVSRAQQALLALGVGPGDRVAAMMPNMPETIIAMLAAASIGATWSSCSPDFGKQGVLDRFGQIEPKVLIAVDGYWYNGKRIEIGDKLAAVAAELPTLEAVWLVDYLGDAAQLADGLAHGAAFGAVLESYVAGEPRYTRLSFDHPLYILFSSGTTGVPKCIVHGAGGTLIQHVKEHRLHCDIRPGDRVFYFTTCGWMMWNWLVSALASGATLLLYDGSPFAPDGNVLFDYATDEGMTFFGTSAKFIDAVRKAELTPAESHDLSALKVIASTGSPLAPENFRFVYEAIKSDVHLASISGGTDIVACFVGANPWGAVWIGEIQAPYLGMAVDIWDDAGAPLTSGKGELVCKRPFPSMPIGFWNDPEGEKYHAAYFDRFDNVWCHGDFAEWTAHGGVIIHGRSDATLNPGGVRIGTAEIYAQVEQLPEIQEAIAIGQDWEGDVRIVLFVVTAPGVVLDNSLIDAVKAKIRSGASPRHVPAKVLAVTDIPRTKSGKITELAVRDVIHGRPVKNKEALANPEALDLFAGLSELQD